MLFQEVVVGGFRVGRFRISWLLRNPHSLEPEARSSKRPSDRFSESTPTEVGQGMGRGAGGGALGAA